jgi:hypothetical protein
LQDYQNKAKDKFTYKIIGCAMKVHNALGRCLAIELGRAGLDCGWDTQSGFCGGEQSNSGTESIDEFRRRSFGTSEKLFGSV